jgi:hypothetical protein
VITVEFGYDTTDGGQMQERPDPFSTFRMPTGTAGPTC